MSATDTNEIANGNAAGMLQFLDYLVEKGYAPPNSVRPWRLAARKILESMEGEDYGSVSVLEINPDEYMDRFVNKKRHEYKAESLAAYRTRFKRAVESYQAYLTEGNAWKPPSFKGARPRSAAPKNADANNTAKVVKMKIGTAIEREAALPAAATPSTLLDYPFPLSTGDLAHLRLPRGLTSKDAERIGAFVKTLAFEPVSDSQDQTDR
jgi:hypothetical protein